MKKYVSSPIWREYVHSWRPQRWGCLLLGCLCLALSPQRPTRPVVVQHPRLHPTLVRNGAISYTTSWIGNTFGGGGKWVQNSVEAMYVAPDGTVFTDSQWDEGGREAGIYRDGDAVLNPQHTHAWGQFGGRAVAANRKYLFIGMRMDNQGGTLQDPGTWPPKGSSWFGISRRRLTDPASGAAFLNGKGGAGDTLKGSFLVVNTAPDGVDASLSGIAADDRRLYVSNPYDSEVRVYDPDTMALTNAFTLERPGPLAIGGGGVLWVIQTGDQNHAPRILSLTADGSPRPETIDDVINPRSVSIDNQGRLMVAEAGPRQQILVYDISAKPTLVQTFGNPGGIYAGTPGEFGDSKFVFPVAAGSDSDGNIYVACSTPGTDIRKFSPSGQLLWRVVDSIFQETAVPNPENESEVLTVFSRYKLDYTQAPGEQWTWVGLTVDPFQYPDDPRLKVKALTAMAIRLVQGKLFLYLVADNSAFLICRFDGSMAVPSVVFAPRHIDSWASAPQPSSRYIWRDVNGDGKAQREEFVDADGVAESDTWGWDVDANGDVWEARESEGIRHFPFQGLDDAQNPIYSRSSSRLIGVPAPFTSIERIKYFADSDTMYVAGYTADHPKPDGMQWGLAGTEIVRFDHWSAGNRTPAVRIVLPCRPPFGGVKAFAVAGDRIFAAMLDSRGSAQKGLPQNLHVYDTSSGNELGQITPGPEVGSAMGWVDLGQGVQAFRLSSGDYSIFVEEVAWGKILLYRAR